MELDLFPPDRIRWVKALSGDWSPGPGRNAARPGCRSAVPPACAGLAQGDAGDPYRAFDRFGRLEEVRWRHAATGGAWIEHLFYGHDKASLQIQERPVLLSVQATYAYEPGTGGLFDTVTYPGAGMMADNTWEPRRDILDTPGLTHGQSRSL